MKRQEGRKRRINASMCSREAARSQAVLRAQQMRGKNILAPSLHISVAAVCEHDQKDPGFGSVRAGRGREELMATVEGDGHYCKISLVIQGDWKAEIMSCSLNRILLTKRLLIKV